MAPRIVHATIGLFFTAAAYLLKYAIANITYYIVQFFLKLILHLWEPHAEHRQTDQALMTSDIHIRISILLIF